ncbi:MAG: sulfite exporter TauE/SafE family protein [Ignavibacteriaceae bacterium]
MEILGYISAVIIGVSLGLIGGGGSILTVPILVYIFDKDAVTATAYSLFIVGVTSLIGSFNYMKKNLVEFRTALIFSVPAFIAVFLSRKFLIPSLPEEFFTIDSFRFTKEIFIMTLFALLMIAAAFSMIRNKRPEKDIETSGLNYPAIFFYGFITGILTGTVGAGGGFLIIPALVLLAKLPMKMAVGTSLLIIAVNSLIGFTGDILSGIFFDWKLLIIFSILAATGIFSGSFLSGFISGSKLKPAFGWFILTMGIYIIITELFFNS